MRAVAAVLTLAVGLFYGCGGSRDLPGEGPATGTLDPQASTLFLSAQRGAIDAPISIQVIARDAAGMVLEGVEIELSSTVSTDVFTTASGTTGRDGSFTAEVRGSWVGPRLVSAALGATLGEVRLAADLELYGLSCPGDVFVGGAAPLLALGTCRPLLVEGDFDADGHDDLLAVYPYTHCRSMFPLPNGSLVLYRGLAGGGLEAGQVAALPTSRHPVAVIPADLDGDGILDLLIGLHSHGDVLSLIESSFLVLKGKGDGSFEEGVEFGAAPALDGVQLGDVDGDGKLDLIARVLQDEEEGLNARWLTVFGSGDGTFRWEERVLSPLIGPAFGTYWNKPWVAGHLDDDGRVDLLWHIGLTLHASLGAGDGTFGEPTLFGSGSFLDGTDWNGDGLLDVALYDEGAGTLRLLFSEGEGSFETKALPLQRRPQQIAFADVDGDGIDDLLVSTGDGLRIFPGEPSGGFVEEPLEPALPAFDRFIAGRFSGEQRADLLIIGGGGLWLSATPRVGGLPGFEALPTSGAGGPAGERTTLEVMADVDGDGILDLITVSDKGSLWILEGGPTSGQQPISLQLEGKAHALHGADLDGDGAAEIIVATGALGELSVRWSAGASLAPLGISFGSEPKAIVSGDWNGDGHLDLAVTGSTTKIYFGSAQGFTEEASLDLGLEGRELVAADLDGDGRLDLAILGARLERLLGDGEGAFEPLEALEVLGGSSLVAADFDGDGSAELALLGEEADEGAGGRIELNQRLFFVSGGELETLPLDERTFLYGLQAADVDWDGSVDLVALVMSDAVGIMRGKGDGSFDPLALYPAGQRPIAAFPGNVEAGIPTLTVVAEEGRAFVMPMDCPKTF